MITTERLKEIANFVWEYGEAETVEIKPPVGVDPLPDEWQEKLGPYQFNRPFIAEVEDVHLAGPALVGVKDNDVILDTAYYGRLDLWERNYPHFEMARDALKHPAMEIELAVSFGGVWSHNYFHWVLDTLSKIEAVRKYMAETGNYPITILENKPPAFVIEGLISLGFSWIKNEQFHFHIERLVVPSNRRKFGMVPPGLVDYLRELYPSDVMYSTPDLYITRKEARNRRVENEEELTDYLLERGYSVRMPENSSFAEQRDMFAGAENIISPHGAGLVNMVWAESPKVIELVTPDYSNPCGWLIAAGKGWDYGFVMCEPLEGENMRVDIGKLHEVVEMM